MKIRLLSIITFFCLSCMVIATTPRLPVPYDPNDADIWGTLLNEFLGVSFNNPGGTLKLTAEHDPCFALWKSTFDNNEADPCFVLWRSTFDNNETDPCYALWYSTFDNNESDPCYKLNTYAKGMNQDVNTAATLLLAGVKTTNDVNCGGNYIYDGNTGQTDDVNISGTILHFKRGGYCGKD